jgi:phosphohistidine phosphatase
MAHLILLRHAKAEAVAASGRDFDRGLTARGVRDAEIMGRALVRAGYGPQRALVSAARRAVQTWDAASPAFGLDPGAVEFQRDLYLASSEHLAAAARANAGSGTLIIVAHNPGLHELALALSGDDPDGRLAGFPTAAAAVFAWDPAGEARLETLLFARDHGGGAA